MKLDWKHQWSLESRGTRRQIGVAAALMVVLPNMVICHLLLFSPDGAYSPLAKGLIGGWVCLAALGGYLLLNRTPRKVSRLRQSLQQIAQGELPANITLPETDDDIRDVERFLHIILTELRHKVELLETQLRLTREMKAVLESQQQELLEAERHRVMINSLGAACHHIGQPATLLRAHLHFLKNQTTTSRELQEIAQCESAVDAIAGILDKLRSVSEYRTVPYRTFPVGVPPGPDREILDIEPVPPPAVAVMSSRTGPAEITGPASSGPAGPGLRR